MTRLVVIGDRTAEEVLETAKLSLLSQFDSIDKLLFDTVSFEAIDAPRLEANQAQVYFIVGIGNPLLKQRIVHEVMERGWQAYSIIHPSAVISPSAKLGSGIYVGALAVISTEASVGDHAIVHIHSSIGHDAVIGRFSAILPGARISGRAEIGSSTLVGSNAFISAGCQVGDNCRIDALTYVSHNLPADSIVSCRTQTVLRRVKGS